MNRLLIELILRYVDYRTFCQCALVSKLFRRCCRKLQPELLRVERFGPWRCGEWERCTLWNGIEQSMQYGEGNYEYYACFADNGDYTMQFSSSMWGDELKLWDKETCFFNTSDNYFKSYVEGLF